MKPWSSTTGMALTRALTSSRAASSTLAAALIDITPSDITSLALMASPPNDLADFTTSRSCLPLAPRKREWALGA